MPISVAASGSQSATLATDHTLTTTTAPAGGAIYQLRVDAANLANSETLALTLRTAPRTGDTIRTLYATRVTNMQAAPLKDSPAVAVPAGVDVVAVLRQEGGTGRAYPWALYRLDG